MTGAARVHPGGTVRGAGAGDGTAAARAAAGDDAAAARARAAQDDAANAVQAPWPAVLVDGAVRLRPMRRRDRRAWDEIRTRNATWLAPWEASDPAGQPPPDFPAYARAMLASARRGECYPFLIELDGRLVGQITVGPVQLGSVRSVPAGYWVDEAVAGRGIAPTALALAFDHAVTTCELHRLEVAIRPENGPSLRVVQKLGFRDEGLRPRFLHVAGEWADHRIFALTREDVPGGLLARWRAVRGAPGEASVAG
jgi:ribosomal-protein-alanine N-acetyltransferase